MATQLEIDRTYDYMDSALRRALGEYPDLSGAHYDGDFSLTLEEAQRAKHEYALTGIGFTQEMRILDIGCGWGPMLQAVRKRGGRAVGITLCEKQAAACRRNGLEAYVKDWKDMTVADYGTFGGIVSFGAFEHFCSMEDYRAGRQDDIYQHFFRLCDELLPSGGRLFLQTMVWERAPKIDDLSLDASKDSDEYIAALLAKFYPGSWLPYGQEQICRNAAPFVQVSSVSGRADYIHTMKEWRKRRIWLRVIGSPELPRLVKRFASDRDFRLQLASLRRSCNRLCFERGIMNHFRMVFAKP